jgi:hypothetical protein
VQNYKLVPPDRVACYQPPISGGLTFPHVANVTIAQGIRGKIAKWAGESPKNAVEFLKIRLTGAFFMR